MTRLFSITAALLLLASGALAQGRRQRLGPPEPPPHLLMERLSRTSPEERDRLFAKLPPERRALIEQRLAKYNELPPAAKERLREEYDQFQQLSPEKQEEVRKLFRQFSELPEERRKAVRRELYRLRGMPRHRVLGRMNSEAFRVEFSEAERQMLESLVTLLSKEPSPQPPASR